MKKNKVTRLLALLVGSAMVLSIAGCSNQETSDDKTKESSKPVESEKAEESSVEESAPEDDLSWLNTETPYPLVKEGTEKTITIYAKGHETMEGEAEDAWSYKFLTDLLNVNMDITTFDINRDEFITLAFASGELPDVIIGGGFSAQEINQYGSVEGQLLDLTPYINEEYMPNATKVFEEHPEFLEACKHPDGSIYSLGYVTNILGAGSLARAFVNDEWLNELGIAIPKTLDEFIDAMYAIKDAGYCEYPIGGTNSCESPLFYILNAMGYVNPKSGTSICLRNGKVALPAADRELLPEYLKIVNQLYKDEIIHPEFFTLDYQSSFAVLAEDCGFMGQCPHVFTQNEGYYFGAEPLTSEWNDTPVWYYNDYMEPKANAIVVSKDCEEVELVLRFIDFFFGEEIEINGQPVAPVMIPSEGYTVMYDGTLTEETLYGANVVVDETTGKYLPADYVADPETYGSIYGYNLRYNMVWADSALGCNHGQFVTHPEFMETYGCPSVEGLSRDEARKVTAEFGKSINGTGWPWVAGEYMIQLEHTTTEIFPTFLFMDEETSTKIADMQIAINEYASQEIAKFITGARELTEDELNDYFDTLEGLGVEEYIQIHEDYWAGIKGE